MPRFRDQSTGAIVSVSDDEAAGLNPGNYIPVKDESRRRAPARRKPKTKPAEADTDNTSTDDTDKE
jgi:hypothetical protein